MKIVLVLFLALIVQASTMFTLTGIKKVYPVIEISGKELPKSFKQSAREEINGVLDELIVLVNTI
ncbi:MAG: hypothetical protein IE887_06790 [Campylobacterales bacterium]|nr:hypothetical protein [Campylobacterales bacterium]